MTTLLAIGFGAAAEAARDASSSLADTNSAVRPAGPTLSFVRSFPRERSRRTSTNAKTTASANQPTAVIACRRSVVSFNARLLVVVTRQAVDIVGDQHLGDSDPAVEHVQSFRCAQHLLPTKATEAQDRESDDVEVDRVELRVTAVPECLVDHG